MKIKLKINKLTHLYFNQSNFLMMRKISPYLNLYRNIKYDLKPYNKLSCIQSKALKISTVKSYAALTRHNVYNFATNSDVEVETAKLIVPYKGYLTIRNSQNMDLSFQTDSKIINILIGKNSTVEDVCQQVKQKLNAINAQFVCDQAKVISGLTPFEALLDRNSFVILNNDYSVKVEGQLLRPSVSYVNKQNFKNLELPLIIRRDIQNYNQRVNTWIQSKYGVGFQNTSIRIPKNQVRKIVVQALVDPQQSTDRMLQKQQQFQKMYWEVQELLDKKNQAAVECSKMVRNRMSLGVFLILANVGFIWSGTYIFYSWDIIEPIAYFVSSLAGIILCSRFFKIKRPFSLLNYKQYMIEKYMPKAMEKVGLDANQLNTKKLQLAELQSQIKDFYLKRL